MPSAKQSYENLIKVEPKKMLYNMENINFYQKKIPQPFIARIQLGNSSFNCERFGICKILMLHEALCEQCYKNTSLATIKIEYNYFTFSFSTVAMNTELFEKHFASATFIMENDFIVDSEKAKMFGYSQAIILQKGYYPIIKNNRILSFTIPYTIGNRKSNGNKHFLISESQAN